MSEAGSKNPNEVAKAAKKAAKGERKEKNAGTAVAVGEQQTDKNYVPRFKKRYQDQIKADLMKKFGYTSVMQVPKINKIVLNIGAGEGAADGKKITQAQNDLTAIAGQKAIVTKAKKAIAAFKITAGRPIGVKVTLRKDKMYEFLDRLVTTALPRVRDFRGSCVRVAPTTRAGRPAASLSRRSKAATATTASPAKTSRACSKCWIAWPPASAICVCARGQGIPSCAAPASATTISPAISACRCSTA